MDNQTILTSEVVGEWVKNGKTIAVLFVEKKSIYKNIPGLDCYDIHRDAKIFTGTSSVIAHPPCRSWSLMKGLAKAPPGEHELAIWAVDVVRRNGGILEHPKGSSLWKEVDLPAAGRGYDDYGGFTLEIDQFWFGHLARKSTWLYICGCKIGDLPKYQLKLGEPTHIVDTTRKKGRTKKYLPKSLRNKTPEPFAKWLIAVAEIIEELKGEPCK